MASDSVGPASASLPDWPLKVIAGLVIVRALVLATAFAVGDWLGSRNFPAWITVLQIAVFVGPALLLLIAGHRDRRAWSLGVYFLDVACTLAEPYVRNWPAPTPLTSLVLGIRTDAFQGAMLCFFAAEFPQPAARSLLRRTFGMAYALMLAIGAALVVVNAFPSPATAAFDRRFAGWFFGVQYLTLPVLALLSWMKLRELQPADRRRAYLLLAGILATVGAVLLAVLLRGALGVRPLADQSAAAWALLFTLAIATLPLVATYAALVQRVLPISVMLRAAAQYVLSKSIVYALAVLPLFGAAVFMFVNRQRPIADVFSGVAGLLLIGATVAGVALLAARRALLDAVDRQFGRRPVQSSGPLTDLTVVLRGLHSIEEFNAVTTGALKSLFGARQQGVFVTDGEGHLHSQQQDLPALSMSGALSQLIGGSDDPLAVSLDPGSPLLRLKESEREWLKRSEAALVAPMRGPGGNLVGLLFVSERVSELPYSDRDRKALGAIASTCALSLYELLARDRESSGAADSSLGARECVECGLLHDADAIACRCGAPLQRAPVPLMLRDQLRFIRRIGTGAMGVAYEARDLKVHQPRAVKALAETDASLMSRLRHEARTMAALSHPNLATFYALESWRAAPLLIIEFCGQGTLADRLQRGPLPIPLALMVCERIAEALAYLHGRGVVHRDVKPSNIGFTDESTPKLLDFGLAKIVEGRLAPATGNDASTYTASLSDSEGAVRGTPAYLSPEALGGASPSPHDDLWSLSVTLLEACVGVNPFKAATPAATAARVMMDDGRVNAATASLPASTAKLVLNLLDRRLHIRPSSAAELQRRLHEAHQGAHHV